MIHDITQEGAPILAGKHSSQVHICAKEYWQLVTTSTHANLSRMNNLNRTHVLFGLQQHTTARLSRVFNFAMKID